jgi:hypothetical protein
MRQFKIVIEKHPESYVAYPIGITGAVSVLTFFRQALASVHHPLNTVVSLIPTADFSLFVNP